MKPLICPQCGGKITDYKPWDNSALCGYCETRFVIEPDKPKPPVQSAPVYEPIETSTATPNVFIAVISAVILVIGGIIFIAVLTSKKDKPDLTYIGNRKSYSSPISRTSPAPTPNPNLLEFGGKGTGNGLFQDADSIAVDKQGRIYVGDDSLRVQQFDAKGKFLKLWQIPSQTENYKRARTINKIAVGDDDNLYVAVGGVILIYTQESTEPVHTLHVAPDYIQDFALRSDGGMLLVSNNDQIETLIYVNKARKITRRIEGFHTDTSEASMSPPETGIAAIRLAVDGANNIYSIYALGDLGSYTLSYNSEDFRIFRFNPEGKYVNKFVQSMNSVGIAVDNKSRIYVSNQNLIEIYSRDGDQIPAVPDVRGIDAFALDRQNNIYILNDDYVTKRAAIQ